MVQKKLGIVFVSSLALVITGCSVGPKYHRPAVPAAPVYKELSPTDPWKTATPNEALIRGNWWEVFNDSQLNTLEQMVDVSNQNVKQAEAQYRAAVALVALNRANYYPTIGAQPAVTSTRLSGNLGARSFGGGIFTLYSIPFNISWEPNFWGRISLAVQNAVANAQAIEADLENIRLSIRANLASDYFQMLGLDMQAKLLRETIVAYERALVLTQDRRNSGIASGLDVAQAQAQLETARAQLDDVILSRAQFEHAIAVLTGQPPSSFSISPGVIPNAPPSIPIGIPSQLLERRPDIAASERQVAAANAQIGLAKVAYYPLVDLTAQGGLESSSLGNLFSWPSRFWSLGLSATQTLFDFGRRRALTHQAEANYDATVAAYRQIVLDAFQQVEDQLSALRQLAEEQAHQETAANAADQAVRLELDRYKEGTASYLDVVTQQTIALLDKRSVVALLQRRMAAAVQLIGAVGGGWDAANLSKP